MSVVLVGVTTNFVVAMSDGRVLNPDDTIQRENYKKIFKINDYVCIGIVGDLSLYKELFTKLSLNKIDTSNIKTDQLFKLLPEMTKEIYNKNNYKDSSLVVCGINSQHETESIGFSTLNFIPNKVSAKISGIGLHTLGDYPNLRTITEKNILKTGNLITGMKDTIKYISTKDHSVNNTIFEERIDL